MRIRWAFLLCVAAFPQAGFGQPMPELPAIARENPPRFAAPVGEEVLAPVEANLPNPMPAAPAAAGETLGLADFEQLALQSNPTLVTAQAKIDAARGEWVQAGLYPNPTIGYHATEVGNLGTAGAQGAIERQRLITAGKRRLDRAVAETDVDTRQVELSAQRLRVLGDVRVRFFDCLVAQRKVALTRELSRIGDDLVRSTAALFDARQASENDLLQAEIEAEQAHILHDNARNEQAAAWRRLTAVAGVPMLAPARLDGDLNEALPEWTWEDCLVTVLRQSPELAAAALRVERARRVTTRARREWIPNVDVGVSLRHANVSGDDIANIEVGIPIPVFDANQGNRRRAEAEWVAAQADLQRIELTLQDRMAVAFRRYANARQQADRYRSRIVDRAERSLDLVANGFRQGQVSYLTLLTAQRTFYQVSLAYLDAQRELRQAAAAIQSQLLRGSLDSRAR